MGRDDWAQASARMCNALLLIFSLLLLFTYDTAEMGIRRDPFDGSRDLVRDIACHAIEAAEIRSQLCGSTTQCAGARVASTAITPRTEV